ncbi:MAG: c-type cytochrome [Acidiferrobacterales bacterium]
MKKVWIVIAAAALFTVACKREAARPALRSTQSTPVSASSSGFSAGQIALGERLFQADCAPCHGAQAQGHAGWRVPRSGLFTAAAPPLNGTGDAWKRSRQQFVDTIEHGARLPDGTVVMPAWKDRLSRTQIRYIVAWFQSLWPPQVYRNWARIQASQPPKS